jgi:hypothetical protein
MEFFILPKKRSKASTTNPSRASRSICAFDSLRPRVLKEILKIR